MAAMHQLVPQSKGISCHAWNADRTMLALCPNNEELHIYEGCNNPDSSKWRRTHVLNEHDMLISGISWSAAHNKIVTCSHDRNAFVWSYDAQCGKWMPTLCVILIERAALDVQWSPDGSKFAVASGAKCASVNYLNTSQSSEWYVCKLIRKPHRSTVLQCAWHPNSQILATASTDFKCRVLSATITDVDAAADAGPFGKALPFGEVYAEFTCNAWVNAVAWSQSGKLLAFAGHDSTVHVVQFGGGGAAPVEQTVRYALLPLNTLLFLGEKALVGGGYDMNPLLFTANSNSDWSFSKALDEKSAVSAAGGAGGSRMASARAMFQAKSSRGSSDGGNAAEDLWTQHANAITSLCALGAASDPTCSTFSSTGMDGRLVVWPLATLGITMAALGI